MGTHGTVTSRRVPSPSLRRDTQRPSEEIQALPHTRQAETARADSLRIESDSGVGNHQRNPVFCPFDLDRRMRRCAVPGDVRQTFLDDPK